MKGKWGYVIGAFLGSPLGFFMGLYAGGVINMAEAILSRRGH